jgi:hypothetical protein
MDVAVKANIIVRIRVLIYHDSIKTEKKKLSQTCMLQLSFLACLVPSDLLCDVFFGPIIDIFKALCTKNFVNHHW